MKKLIALLLLSPLAFAEGNCNMNSDAENDFTTIYRISVAAGTLASASCGGDANNLARNVRQGFMEHVVIPHLQQQVEGGKYSQECGHYLIQTGFVVEADKAKENYSDNACQSAKEYLIAIRDFNPK